MRVGGDDFAELKMFGATSHLFSGYSYSPDKDLVI